MTREEEIRAAVESNLDVSFYTPKDGELLKETFYFGAKWADKHPNMELKDYTTEELKAELKRRVEELKADKAKVKRCRMCKHWGEITYMGIPTTENTILSALSRCCKFFLWKTGRYYKCHRSSQLACEHFEDK